MQNIPPVSALLGDIARLLDDQILPAVPAALSHNVRVAANLLRIIERELELGPGFDAVELARYESLVHRFGRADGDVESGNGEADNGEPDIGEPDETISGDSRSPLGGLIQHSFATADIDLQRSLWAALVETTRADVSICKPGYEQWTGQ